MNTSQTQVNFVTDSSTALSGFKLAYKGVKWLFTEPLGFIQSEPVSLNITYVIRAPVDHLIQLVVEEFDFERCVTASVDEQVRTPVTACLAYNDHVEFVNERGDLDAEIYGKLMRGGGRWAVCACNRPGKTYVSLTNEMHVRYVVSDLRPRSSSNSFRFSYKFVPAVQTRAADTIRVVQEDLTGGFVGGYALRIRVPVQNHLRIYGKSAKV
jgi:hypothetical protein